MVYPTFQSQGIEQQTQKENLTNVKSFDQDWLIFETVPNNQEQLVSK